MIDIQCFKLHPFAAFYVVGTRKTIGGLRAFTKHHHNTGTLTVANFINRLQMYNVFCHVMPLSRAGQLATRQFQKQLDQSNHSISLDAYREAYVVAHPELVIRDRTFTLEDTIDIIRNSIWLKILDLDAEALVQRLMDHIEHD